MKIGAFEAGIKLGHLLDLVEAGEDVTMTREEARAAIQRLRDRAIGPQFGAFDRAEWKSFRDEGRN